jgi:DivIVA domain-containing protein
MDRTSLADELRAARFRTTRFRTGYDEGSADDLIDLLAGQLVAGAADHEIVATVEASRFPTTTARRGYETADVDALLARVTSTLGGTTTTQSRHGSADTGQTGDASGTRSTSSPSSSGADLPSALIEPPRGFLARLLGR